MGRIRTKYGTRGELVNAISSLHNQGIKFIADIVMNHMLGSEISKQMDVSLSEPAGTTSVEAWTDFDFNRESDANPRGKAYSSFTWNDTHFDGMEYNGNYYLFDGKTLDNVNIFTGETLMRSDVILGMDLDHQNSEVTGELIRWNKWLTEALNLDGYRVDAVRHIDNDFIVEWADEMSNYLSSKGVDPIIFAENWDGWSKRLNSYAWRPASGASNTFNDADPDDYNGIDNSMQLFDVPLHYTFYQIATDDGKDMTALIDDNTVDAYLRDNALVKYRPTQTITFVDNHDTVPDQPLASYIPSSFKLAAYTFILLYNGGTPCIFYRDLYKGNYTGKYTNTLQTEYNTNISALMTLYHEYSTSSESRCPNSHYGLQGNNDDVYTYARSAPTEGTWNGKSLVFAIKRPQAVASMTQWCPTFASPGTTFTQVLGDYSGGVTPTVNGSGWAEFGVGSGNFAVWIEN
jgi:alpha-amylase